MPGKTGAVFLFITCCLFLFSCSERIVVLTYNVENLFDDLDEGSEYPEYSGENWNRELYRQKLAAIARAVRAASARGPDILCVQEIESEKALRELRDRHLKGLGYRYLVFVPQQGAPTNVGCLSRLPVVRTRIHSVGSFEGVPLRHILELQLERDGSILHLFNNHWKSKTGGVEQTAIARRQAADVLVKRLREILHADPWADVLVVGDLNENLQEYEQAAGRYRTATVPYPGGDEDFPAQEYEALYFTSMAKQAGPWQDRVVLYEPWFETEPRQRGSSVYEGRWQTPDRLLLSRGLFDESGFTYLPGSFAVLKKGFLLDPQSGFPRRWRWDARGKTSGTSDHLPLRLILTQR
jgi:endonuclease/exonuclease/phosphatase family metal-dependent hydrolase